MSYLVMSRGKQTVCPVCAGMMHPHGSLEMKCYDCGRIYRCIGYGYADSELVYEEVEK